MSNQQTENMFLKEKAEICKYKLSVWNKCTNQKYLKYIKFIQKVKTHVNYFFTEKKNAKTSQVYCVW